MPEPDLYNLPLKHVIKPEVLQMIGQHPAIQSQQTDQNYNTVLNRDDETQFQAWKARYAPRDSGEDYDLRGAYKAGLTPDPQTGHWPDTFKKPNHPTFSDQSQYAPLAPEKAGSWQGDTYIPHQQPTQQPPPQYIPQGRISAYRSPEYQPQALFQPPIVSPFPQQGNIPAPNDLSSLPGQRLTIPASPNVQPAQAAVIPPNQSRGISPIIQAAQPAQAQTAQAMPNYPRVTTPAAAGGVRQMTPDYSYREIPKAPALAGSQEDIPVPRREDYDSHGFARVLNAITGGLAGAAGGPLVGAKIGTMLADRKYNDAMDAYKNLTADQKRRMDIEKEQYERGLQGTTAGVQTGSKTATDIDKATIEQILKQKADTGDVNAQTRVKQQEDTARHRKVGEQIADFKAHNLTFNQMEAKALTYPEDSVERQSLMDGIKEIKQSGWKPIELQKTEAAARAEGAAIGNLTPAGRQAASILPGVKAKSSTTGKIEAETTPEAIALQAKLKEAQSWATATTNEKDSAHKAQIVQQRMPDIKKNIQTLASDDIFGNRWKEFMTGKLGTNPQFAPLRADIGMLQGAITNIHVGGKGSSGYLKKFEDMFNVKSMTRETLTNSINEIEKWVNEYAKNPTSKLEDIDKKMSVPKTKSGITVTWH